MTVKKDGGNPYLDTNPCARIVSVLEFLCHVNTCIKKMKNKSHNRSLSEVCKLKSMVCSLLSSSYNS